MATWQLSEPNMEQAEWFLWNPEIAAERPDRQEAVAEFEADRAANETAAEDVTRWFRREAVDQGACVTRILVVEGHAKVTATLQGTLALTLDPADKKTQAMWLRRGFVRTMRRAGPGLHRLYVPLRGPYYGPIDRG